MPDFSKRSRADEIMDNFALDHQELDPVLKELEVINKLLGGFSVFYQYGCGRHISKITQYLICMRILIGFQAEYLITYLQDASASWMYGELTDVVKCHVCFSKKFVGHVTYTRLDLLGHLICELHFIAKIANFPGHLVPGFRNNFGIKRLYFKKLLVCRIFMLYQNGRCPIGEKGVRQPVIQRIIFLKILAM